MILTVQDLMADMVKFAQKQFASAGEVLPMWILVVKDGAQSVYLTPFSNDTDKDLTSALIRAKAVNAVLIGFMSETWYVSAPTGTSKEDAMDIVPSEHPDRHEAIFITAESITGSSIAGVIEIKRDSAGKGTLDEYKESGFSSTSGRFANLFPKTTVH